MKLKIFSMMFIAILSAFIPPALGGEPEADFRIIKISPRDGTAVIQPPGKGLQLIRTGDRVEGLGLIKEIAENQIRVEVTTPKGLETWIISQEKGKQTVKKMFWYKPEQPLHWAPDQSFRISPDGDDGGGRAAVEDRETEAGDQPAGD